MTDILPENDAPEGTPARPATFWRSDYRRLAGDLRRVRYELDSYGSTLKGQVAQDTIDAAANALADILQADSDAADTRDAKYVFDREQFLRGAGPTPEYQSSGCHCGVDHSAETDDSDEDDDSDEEA